jgi:hypothetical protein
MTSQMYAGNQSNHATTTPCLSPSSNWMSQSSNAAAKRSGDPTNHPTGVVDAKVVSREAPTMLAASATEVAPTTDGPTETATALPVDTAPMTDPTEALTVSVESGEAKTNAWTSRTLAPRNASREKIDATSARSQQLCASASRSKTFASLAKSQRLSAFATRSPPSTNSAERSQSASRSPNMDATSQNGIAMSPSGVLTSMSHHASRTDARRSSICATFARSQPSNANAKRSARNATSPSTSAGARNSTDFTQMPNLT